jgi:hypothetical protein
MKIFFAIFTLVVIFAAGVGVLAAMDITPEQQLVRRVIEPTAQ